MICKFHCSLCGKPSGADPAYYIVQRVFIPRDAIHIPYYVPYGGDWETKGYPVCGECGG